MATAIKAKLFQNQNTVALARDLIGTRLVVRTAEGGRTALRITETEAYHGEEDRACHARVGRTARTEVMYAAGGVWYVYLCYGVHEMLNLVTGPRDQPSAVLIRGVMGIEGPGRLTKALGIDRRFNGQAARPATGLWMEDDGFRPPADAVIATPRVGVAYAGPVWAGMPWRFVWERAGAAPAKNFESQI